MLCLLDKKILHRAIILVCLFSLLGGMITPLVTQAEFEGNPVDVGPVTYNADGKQVGGSPPPATKPATAGGGDNIGLSTQLGQMIGGILLSLASSVTWLGGVLLEKSIQWFVLDIGTILGNKTTLGLMIGKLWGLIRDMCNLIFIFGFIYTGIRTIIFADDSGAKRMLASLIIAALLINFSLFFTKIIIDFSNYTAVEIYNATFQGESGTSLSSKFAKSLGIYDFYDKPLEGDKLARLTTGGSFAFYFMAAIMLVVAGFIFAAGALLLIVRFVTLVFIMIFSPLLFAATVFPNTASTASSLWKQLINSSLFAPTYLILLLISVRIIGAVTTSLGGTTNGVANALGKGTADSFGVILVFIVGIMFLILSLKVSQKFGFAGADKAMSIAHNVRGRAQGTLGRNTIGWGSNKLLKKYEKDDARIGEMKGARGAVLRTIRSGLNVTGADKGIRNALTKGKKATFGSDDSYYSNKEWEKELKGKRAEINEYDTFKSSIKNGIENGGTDQAAQIAMERAVADASIKYLEELDQADREKIATYMTQSQVDGLDKSDKLTETDKRNINDARKKTLEKMFEINKDKLSKATVEQLNSLGAAYLVDERHAVRLNSSQMDDLKKKLTRTEYSNVSKARDDALLKLASGTDIVSGTDTLNHEFITRQKAGEIAKMSPEVLVQMAEMIPVAALGKIAQDATVNKENQEKIRQQIEAASQQNLSPSDREHIDTALEFFKNNPLGKQFGR